MDSLFQELHELVDNHWPCAIIFEVGPVTASLFDQVIEEVPDIFGHNQQFLPFQLTHHENVPLIKELAFMGEVELPNLNCCLDFDVSLPKFSGKAMRKLVDFLKCVFVFELGITFTLQGLLPRSDVRAL